MTQQRTYAALRQLLIPSNSTLCLGLKRRAKTDPTPIPTRKKVTAEYKSYSSFVAPSIKSRSFARKEFCLARRLRFAGYDLHLRSAAAICLLICLLWSGARSLRLIIELIPRRPVHLTQEQSQPKHPSHKRHCERRRCERRSADNRQRKDHAKHKHLPSSRQEEAR